MKISKDIKDLNNESSWDDLAMPYQSASKEYQEIKPSLRDEAALRLTLIFLINGKWKPSKMTI